MSSKMSAAKEAKARRSRLKRPSKAKLSLLKQVLVKNCFSKAQKVKIPPKEPHQKTDTERVIESIFGSALQPVEVDRLGCNWPKKSLESIFAAPFQPVGFAFKQDKSSLSLDDEERSFTTLEAADLDAWDESWDQAWAKQLSANNGFKSGGKMFSLQENQDVEDEEEEEEGKIQPSLTPLNIPILGGASEKELAKYQAKMDEYEQESKNKTSPENSIPSHLNFS